MSISISKRDLWRYVNRKTKRLIHRHHVLAVISALFEEMIKDLKEGKPIKVANLGTIVLQPTKPRWYHHVTLHKMVLSPGYRVMRFILSKPVHKKIVSMLDLDKTLRDD